MPSLFPGGSIVSALSTVVIDDSTTVTILSTSGYGIYMSVRDVGFGSGSVSSDAARDIAQALIEAADEADEFQAWHELISQASPTSFPSE